MTAPVSIVVGNDRCKRCLGHHPSGYDCTPKAVLTAPVSPSAPVACPEVEVTQDDDCVDVNISLPGVRGLISVYVRKDSVTICGAGDWQRKPVRFDHSAFAASPALSMVGLREKVAREFSIALHGYDESRDQRSQIIENATDRVLALLAREGV
jgi:hypothetical protein